MTLPLASTHQSVISASGFLLSERKTESQPASTGTSSLSLLFVWAVGQNEPDKRAFVHLRVLVMLKMQTSHNLEYIALGDERGWGWRDEV